MNTHPTTTPASTAPAVLTAIHNDSILAVKDRELAIVAALAAMGRKTAAQLAIHIHNALDAGATQQQIVEGLATISQASGTPTAVNSIAIAHRVFNDRDAAGTATDPERVWDNGDAPGGTVDERWERSLLAIQEVYPAGPTDDTYTAVAERAPHFWRDAANIMYNDLFGHPGIDFKYRELFVMSTYVALNSTPLQMKWHTNGALNTGWTRQEVLEIITQLTPYVGVPHALAAARLAHEVFTDRDARGTVKPHETRTRPETSALSVARLHYVAETLMFDAALDGPAIDARIRHIAVISALAAHGADTDQLQLQVRAALHAGVTSDEILEAVRLSAAVGGYVVAGQAETAARAILDRPDSAH